MIVKSVEFKCDDSMHMKAIAVLIKKASAFNSRIWLTQGGRKANAKSLLGVMSLGIDNGSLIDVSAEGVDENAAIDEITSYLANPVL
ncbi:MAG: HPr family phosphocarrier protein [Fastidiosipilaceae bacterium]|jgi:phosphotransferase system HPr (HPr) family protein